MITAEEARRRSQEVNRVDDEYMENIYTSIDSGIEEAIKQGQFEVPVAIDGRNEPWEVVETRRRLIKERYERLGYTVECLGYSRALLTDQFTIKW